MNDTKSSRLMWRANREVAYAPGERWDSRVSTRRPGEEVAAAIATTSRGGGEMNPEQREVPASTPSQNGRQPSTAAQPPEASTPAAFEGRERSAHSSATT